jgi:NitT/TauT family transport system substrate-binding protein
MHEILNGKQALGKDFTFIAGVTTRKFHDEKPKEYEAVLKAVVEAMEYMKDNRKEAAEILSRQYEMSVEEVEKNLSMEGMEYSLSIKGVNDFAGFMERNGYISKTPGNIKEIVWDEKNYED